MTDWKSIATARGLDLPESVLEAHIATMSQLEEAVAALKPSLPHDTEPATVFQPAILGENRR